MLRGHSPTHLLEAGLRSGVAMEEPILDVELGLMPTVEAARLKEPGVDAGPEVSNMVADIDAW